MHQEILNQQQLELLPLMAQFSREYYLVGGTAIALHLGHRRSIDFDMFKASTINHRKNLIQNPPTDEDIKSRLTEISTTLL